MEYNLFIVYDLMDSEQNVDAVSEAIKGLGRWWQFQSALFYVNTEHSANAAFSIVNAATNGNDRIAVIDANAWVVGPWDRPPIDAANSI
ncbi:MAG: hypothetical protein ACU0CY_12565 [Maritimibacter harenae]